MSEIETDKDGNIISESTKPIFPTKSPELIPEVQNAPVGTVETIEEPEKRKLPVKWIGLGIGVVIVIVAIIFLFSLSSNNYLSELSIPEGLSFSSLANAIKLNNPKTLYFGIMTSANATLIQPGKLASLSLLSFANSSFISHCNFINCYNITTFLGLGVGGNITTFLGLGVGGNTT
jgi:hypothetical protein